DLLGDEVEELRELDHLAVGAAGDVRRILETRVLVDPDQLDALREGGGPRRGNRSRLLLRRGGGLVERDGLVSPRRTRGGGVARHPSASVLVGLRDVHVLL